jgi:ATP-dependent RNA helicase RhlE
MRNTYRPRFRSFVPKTSSAQVISAIRKSSIDHKPETAEVVYVAKNTFKSFNITEELKNNISIKQYDSPTPIQDQSIPLILEGKDVIGIANTGTGKTAAFLIPLIDKIYKNKNRSEKVFILAPTRELAVQINDELRDFTYGMKISSVLLIGGANMFRQKKDLRRNPDFVIGTPGRVKDLIRQRALNLSYFKNVVLDEADRMVDIGFINDIKYFISLLPKERQSLFFSATISGRVSEILTSFVRNPVTVTVKKNNVAENIKQEIVETGNKGRKVDQLHNLLSKDGFDKVLIFGRTKWGVQKLADELINRGFKAGAIHGNKGQNQRQRILDEFKKNEINILLATDVASRGLDIPNVSHVINYDMPATYDDYVHRIGRTGRADKKGIALTFVDSY